MAKWLDGVVIENVRQNERLTSLKIDAPLHTFQPGQFVRVGLDIEGEVVARPYSLVSLPGKFPIEIYFNIVPDGPLSPSLFALEKGDSVLVAPNPAGFLTLDEVPECRHLWMIATGTGVGPFLSILSDDAVWQRFERVVLCYSVRTADELAYGALIESVRNAYPTQFRFLAHVTRESIDDTIHQRVSTSLKDGTLESRAETGLSADDSHVMMCGSTDMIKDVSELLEARGMRRHRRREPGHYTTEKYH